MACRSRSQSHDLNPVIPGPQASHGGRRHGAVVLGWYANDMKIWISHEHDMNMTWTCALWTEMNINTYINLWLLPNQLVPTFQHLLPIHFEMTVHLWKPEDGHDPNTATFRQTSGPLNIRREKVVAVKMVFLTPSLGASIENTTIALYITHITQEIYPSKPSSSNPRESTWQSSYWRIRHGIVVCFGYLFETQCYQRYLKLWFTTRFSLKNGSSYSLWHHKGMWT